MILDQPGFPYRDHQVTNASKSGVSLGEPNHKLSQSRELSSIWNITESRRQTAIVSKLMKLKAKELSLCQELEKSIQSTTDYHGQDNLARRVAEKAKLIDARSTRIHKDPRASSTTKDQRSLSRSYVNTTSYDVHPPKYSGSIHPSQSELERFVHTRLNQTSAETSEVWKPTIAKPLNPPKQKQTHYEFGGLPGARCSHHPKSALSLNCDSKLQQSSIITSNHRTNDPVIDTRSLEPSQINQSYLKLNIFFKKNTKCDLSKAFFCSGMQGMGSNPTQKKIPGNSGPDNKTSLSKVVVGGAFATGQQSRPQATGSELTNIGMRRKSGPARQIDLGLSKSLYQTASSGTIRQPKMYSELPIYTDIPEPELVVSELVSHPTTSKTRKDRSFPLESAIPTEESQEEAAYKNQKNKLRRNSAASVSKEMSSLISPIFTKSQNIPRNLFPSTASYLHPSLVSPVSACQSKLGRGMSREGSRRKLSEVRKSEKSHPGLGNAEPQQAGQIVPRAGQAPRLSGQQVRN